jgi:hypothetical protein
MVRAGALDWDRALAEAARWRIGGVVAYVVRVVARALDTPVPPEVLARCAPSRLHRLAGRLVGDGPLALTGDGGGTRAYLAETLLMDRPRWALRVAITTLFPPTAWLTHHYGLRAVPVARALHPLRVAALAARGVLRRPGPC